MAQKKKAKKFEVTVDTAFPKVMQGCMQQHGESWLYPPVRKNFLALFLKGKQCPDSFPSTLHSIEVWDRDSGTLAAGELGFVCGSCYTSLSGFYAVPGAGSVQICALGGMLVLCGFTMWDLGMSLPYKEAFGGNNVPREEFVSLFHSKREQKVSKLTVPAKTADSVVSSATNAIAALLESRARLDSTVQENPTLQGTAGSHAVDAHVDLGTKDNLKISDCDGDVKGSVIEPKTEVEVTRSVDASPKSKSKKGKKK